MATTTRKPRRNQALEGIGGITISQHTLPKARTGQATMMQSIVQDRYGATPEDVLRLCCSGVGRYNEQCSVQKWRKDRQ